MVCRFTSRPRATRCLPRLSPPLSPPRAGSRPSKRLPSPPSLASHGLPFPSRCHIVVECSSTWPSPSYLLASRSLAVLFTSRLGSACATPPPHLLKLDREVRRLAVGLAPHLAVLLAVAVRRDLRLEAGKVGRDACARSSRLIVRSITGGEQGVRDAQSEDRVVPDARLVGEALRGRCEEGLEGRRVGRVVLKRGAKSVDAQIVTRRGQLTLAILRDDDEHALAAMRQLAVALAHRDEGLCMTRARKSVPASDSRPNLPDLDARVVKACRSNMRDSNVPFQPLPPKPSGGTARKQLTAATAPLSAG
jgi:hypothetical protein